MKGNTESSAAAPPSEAAGGFGRLSKRIPPAYWIIGPRWDLPLILLTPVILLPVFLLGESTGWGGALLVFFGVLPMGHYLPGMMRAYGDKELFRRFRVRLTLVPVVLLAICGAFSYLDLRATVLLLALWGGWHWMMQIYGFARIYDAKAGAVARGTARLDYLLCILVYISCILHNDRLDGFVRAFYRSGGPLSPVEVFDVVQTAWLALTALVAVVYAGSTLRGVRRGEPLNPLKLVIMGVAFPYLSFTLSLVQTPLLAFLMFESFHDIQYLALVWAFNRTRVERDADAGDFLRFLFRKKGSLVLLYIALCLSFGSWDLVARSIISDDTLQRVALSFVSAMAFLHYYLDGFIWKIRETKTQQSLDVSVAPVEPWSLAEQTRHFVSAKWLPQAAMWLLLFVVPMALLGAAQGRLTQGADLEIEESLATAFPRSPGPHLEMCQLAHRSGDFVAAARHCRRALELSPGWFEANNDLAAALQALGRPEEALLHYREALRRKPDDAALHQNLGLALGEAGDTPAAKSHFEIAIALDPDPPSRATAYYQLGEIYRRDRKLGRAEASFRDTIARDEGHSGGHHSLAIVLALRGKADEGLAHFERAVEIDPNDARAHLNLARLLARMNRPDQAEEHLQRAHALRAPKGAKPALEPGGDRPASPGKR